MSELQPQVTEQEQVWPFPSEDNNPNDVGCQLGEHLSQDDSEEKFFVVWDKLMSLDRFD